MAQIRRSQGRIYGLGLALFDGLLYPLLLLNAVLTIAVIWTGSNLAQPLLHPLPRPLGAGIVLAVAVCAGVDLYLVRSLWRILGSGAALETNARFTPRRQVAWGLGGLASVILLVALAAWMSTGPFGILRPGGLS